MSEDRFSNKIKETFVRLREADHLHTSLDLSSVCKFTLPSRKETKIFLEDIFKVFYPAYYGEVSSDPKNAEGEIQKILQSSIERLDEQVRRAYEYFCDQKDPKNCQKQADDAVSIFLEKLPGIRKELEYDIQAAYDGDPAATSTNEVVFSYPGLVAVTIYRLANELLKLGVPLLPRFMSEMAHARTGIDIHPGAKIGRAFFIDHGTGVVIGETTIIGDNVKIYQGVTLGALSIPHGEEGKKLRGQKRHPTLCDHVTVYAGATILGGETIIGEGCVIGGNTWLTQSVPPHTKVITENRYSELEK